MKTKVQKEEDVKEAQAHLAKSKVLLFADFAKMSAEDLRKLRREMASSGAKFTVVKKRLLNVMFKEQGIDYDARSFEGSVGTIFAEGTIDTVSGPLYRTLQGFGSDQKTRDAAVQRILGAYDLEAKAPIERDMVMRIGTLPPRDVVLAQFLGMLAAPVRSFLYLLDQKSKQAETVEAKA